MRQGTITGVYAVNTPSTTRTRQITRGTKQPGRTDAVAILATAIARFSAVLRAPLTAVGRVITYKQHTLALSHFKAT